MVFISGFLWTTTLGLQFPLSDTVSLHFWFRGRERTLPDPRKLGFKACAILGGIQKKVLISGLSLTGCEMGS